LVRGADHGDDGHVRIELDLHEATNDPFGHELVPIDASIDNQPSPNDGSVPPATSEPPSV
jgi:hypothetical protein